jgi:BarA-like signal transduction histidine kinase
MLQKTPTNSLLTAGTLSITNDDISDIDGKTIEKRTIDVLIKEINALKKEIESLRQDKLKDALKLTDEVLEKAGYVSKPNANRLLKRGRHARPILEAEILEAQKACETAHGCARYLGVGYFTYRRWAMYYGIHRINLKGKKLFRLKSPYQGKYPVNEIIEGKFPDYPVYKLKDKLIRGGIKKPKCEICGFSQRRNSDNKIPIILNFEDNNPRNHKLDNIRLLCYNCTFLHGKGYFRKASRSSKKTFEDPDRLQGSNEEINSRF